MYKIVNNLIDTQLHDLHTNTDSFKHSFFPHIIYRWNRLPQHEFETKAVNAFTNKVTKHLTNMSLTQTQTLNLFPQQRTNYMRDVHFPAPYSLCIEIEITHD